MSQDESEKAYTGKPIEDTIYARFANCSSPFENKDENDAHLRHCLLASLNKDPINYEEAISTKEKEYWKYAIREEIDSLNANKVWVLIDRPKTMHDGKRANIIDSKWVFKRKLKADGSTRNKSRLVIRGFEDKNFYDLKDTYAPVSRLSVVRSLLSIINKYDLHACQLVVKTAF